MSHARRHTVARRSGRPARGRRRTAACLLAAAVALSSAEIASADTATFKRDDYTFHDDARAGSNALAAGDFDDDGRDDLAVAVRSFPGIAALLGKPGDTFARTNYATPTVAEDVATGDFNGDGRSDIAAALRQMGVVGVWLAQPGGGFGARADYETDDGPTSVAVADFNRDGNDDLAVANHWSDSVSVLHGRPDGSFAARTDHRLPVDPYVAPTAVAAADFDGDLLPDLAVTHWNPYAVTVLLGQPGGGFGSSTTYGVEARPMAVAAADFDADGDPDLAVANQWSNSISVRLGQPGGGFGPRTDYRTAEMPVSVSVGDFNADGDPDLAVANSYWDEAVSLFYGRAGGSFAPRIDHQVGERLTAATVGDFNGDGVSDFAAAHDWWRVSVFTNSTWLPELTPSSADLVFDRSTTSASSRRSSYRTLGVTNTGRGSLRVSPIAVEGPHAPDFRVVSDGCAGRALPPGGSCAVAVRFSPLQTGHRRAVLRLDSNAYRSPHRVDLAGTACLSYLTLSFFGATSSTWVGCP